IVGRGDLRRGQGRTCRARQVGGARGRPRRHHGELRVPGPDRHASLPRPRQDVGRGRAHHGGARARHPDAAAREAGGRGARRRLPRLRRGGLHHGTDVVGERWSDDGLVRVSSRPMIAAVIPCFRVKRHILEVLAAVPPAVERIYVVDDACPEGTGDLVESAVLDPRVRVLRHVENQGVGAATLTGYRTALADGARVVVRLDADGQMDPALIPRLVAPILDGEADYAKGNRFFELEGLRAMPRLRLAGNSLLSFASKLSSGYWNVFDPTNGFTAIHAEVLRRVPLE